MGMFTRDTPKNLIPVAGRPFADYQLSWLAAHGVSHIVYCIGHLGDQIREYVGDGRPWGLPVQYSDEGEALRGTAGALRKALDDGVLDECFLVLYGDSFLPVDLRRLGDAFSAQRRPAMMAVFRNEHMFDQGNVQFADGIVHLYQKDAAVEKQPEMPYIDYGVSAMRSQTIQSLVPRGARADLADLFHVLSRRGALAGLEYAERFYEIGSVQGLRDFQEWVNMHELRGRPAI